MKVAQAHPRSPPRSPAALSIGAAQAQVSDNVIKIGVLSDMSEPLHRPRGRGLVIAARMAVDDSGIEKRGYKVRGRLGRSPEQAGRRLGHRAPVVRPGQVDVIVDVPNSGVALAVNQITKEKGKVFLANGPGVVGPHRQGVLALTPFTGRTTPGCSPTAPAARS
jgi:branched-chain amino acid transport system substrate-binding protein